MRFRAAQPGAGVMIHVDKPSIYAIVRSAVALISAGAVVLMAGAAGATDAAMQGSMRQCATTSNQWVLSGYCEAHNAWDKFYCQCNYMSPTGGGGGGDDDADNDRFRRGLGGDIIGDEDDLGDGDVLPDDDTSDADLDVAP